MTTTATGLILTTAEYARLIGKSERQARRLAAALKCATKVKGRWGIALTNAEARGLRRKLVELERALSGQIGALPWGESIDALVVKKDRVREQIDAIDSTGRLLLAIDHAKIWRGRTDKYGATMYSRAVREIDGMVAA